MRGFRKKLEWQNKFLEGINLGLPAQQQLPGLTATAITQWKVDNANAIPKELHDIAVQAATFSDSVNDFSMPTEMTTKRAEKKLSELYEVLGKYNAKTPALV